MLCLFRLSDSDDVLAALYFGSRHSTKKNLRKKKLKSKIVLLLLFFRQTEPPKNVNRSIAVVKLQRRGKKVHKSDACWPPNVAKLCRACVSSLIFNSGHISDVT